MYVYVYMSCMYVWMNVCMNARKAICIQLNSLGGIQY
jgi:hypothetical protein